MPAVLLPVPDAAIMSLQGRVIALAEGRQLEDLRRCLRRTAKFCAVQCLAFWINRLMIL